MRSLSDQLLELVQLANQNGLYDAADWLQARLWSETAIGLHPANERLQRPVKRTDGSDWSHSELASEELESILHSPTQNDK